MEIQGTSFPVKEQPAGGRDNIEKLFIDELDRQQEFEQDMVENVIQSVVEKNERNDQAEISDETCQDDAEKERITKLLDKLFDKLEIWTPSYKDCAVKDLEQLKELYTLMLEKILQIPGEEGQKVLLSKLEIQILKALEQYSAKYLGTIDGFFKQFGNNRDIAALLNSLFKAVTGRCLSSEKINTILEFYRTNPSANPRTGRNMTGQEPLDIRGRTAEARLHKTLESRAAAPQESQSSGTRGQTLLENRPEGILYPRSVTEKNKSQNNAFSEKQLAKADYMGALHNTMKESHIAEDFFAKPSKYGVVFNARDLKLTEDFLADFLGKDNLLKNTEISAHNQEVKGLLAAVTWLKADTFLQTAGIQKGLRSSVGQSVDKMIHFYVSLAAENKTSNFPADLKNGNEGTKECSVYTIYYQIKSICQKEKNAGNALTAGLKYAYEQFEKRKGNENFFFLHSENPQKDCKKGFLLLKKNWKRFTEKLPVSIHEKKELDYSFESPWGMYIAPASSANTIYGKHPVFIGAAIIAVIIVLCFLFT